MRVPATMFLGRAAYFYTTNTFIVSMKSSLACMN
jgi:hypothetical protein